MAKRIRYSETYIRTAIKRVKETDKSDYKRTYRLGQNISSMRSCNSYFLWKRACKNWGEQHCFAERIEFEKKNDIKDYFIAQYLIRIKLIGTVIPRTKIGDTYLLIKSCSIKIKEHIFVIIMPDKKYEKYVFTILKISCFLLFDFTLKTYLLFQ